MHGTKKQKSAVGRSCVSPTDRPAAGQPSSVYDIITGRIIEQLEAGTVPWRKPWTSGAPRNMVSGKEYRGINAFLLSCAPFKSPCWLTFKQAAAGGGSVRKGEKGYPVFFWSFPTEEQKAEAKAAGRERAPIVRYYTVFNVEQCDGLKTPEDIKSLSQAERVASAEALVDGMPKRPSLQRSEAAWYSLSTDTVGMPAFEAFESAAHFYSTLFHELTHSTGHEARLDRDGIQETTYFGSSTYAKEELVAEMGAAMLCGVVGLDVIIEHNASYIANWLQKLRNDRRLVIQAASQAQKAADYIRGIQHGESE